MQVEKGFSKKTMREYPAFNKVIIYSLFELNHAQKYTVFVFAVTNDKKMTQSLRKVNPPVIK